MFLEGWERGRCGAALPLLGHGAGMPRAGVGLAGSTLMFRSSRDEQFQGVERPREVTCPIAAAGTAVLPAQGWGWQLVQASEQTADATLGKRHCSDKVGRREQLITPLRR